MSEQAVESCELGLSVCSAAHAAEVGDCEVSAVCFLFVVVVVVFVFFFFATATLICCMGTCSPHTVAITSSHLSW